MKQKIGATLTVRPDTPEKEKVLLAYLEAYKIPFEIILKSLDSEEKPDHKS